MDQKEAALTGTELQQLNNNSNTKPNVEETVNTIANRLKERRREMGLPESVKVSAAIAHSIQMWVLWSDSLRGRISFHHLFSCAGDVPFPDDYGENQPAEVFALLWESAWTTGKATPAVFILVVVFNYHFCPTNSPKPNVFSFTSINDREKVQIM